MGFKRGYTPWNKGLTKETDERLKSFSESKKGKPHPNRGHPISEETKQKLSEAHKGKRLSEEHKRKISISLMGNKNGALSGANRGAVRSEETREKMSKSKRGKKNPNWQNGISFEPYSPEFNEALKEKIRERDNRQCQECGIAEKELVHKLDVHHIDYDKKNNESKNLISLCRECHGKTNFTRENWTEYFRGFMVEIP